MAPNDWQISDISRNRSSHSSFVVARQSIATEKSSIHLICLAAWEAGKSPALLFPMNELRELRRPVVVSGSVWRRSTAAKAKVLKKFRHVLEAEERGGTRLGSGSRDPLKDSCRPDRIMASPTRAAPHLRLQCRKLSYYRERVNPYKTPIRRGYTRRDAIHLGEAARWSCDRTCRHKGYIIPVDRVGSGNRIKCGKLVGFSDFPRLWRDSLWWNHFMNNVTCARRAVCERSYRDRNYYVASGIYSGRARTVDDE